MPTLKDLRCTIHTKEGPLEEYQLEADGHQSSLSPDTRTVYIQAHDGADFWIACEVLPGYKATVGDRVSFRVFLDGEDMGSLGLAGSECKDDIKGIYSRDSSGHSFVQPFQFSKIPLGMSPKLRHKVANISDYLTLVEDHDSETHIDEGLLQKIGEISIIVQRTTRRQPSKEISERITQALSAEELNEKVLKGTDLTHITKYVGSFWCIEATPSGSSLVLYEARLGPKEATSSYSVWDVDKWDTIENPYVGFRILYRSKRELPLYFWDRYYYSRLY